MNSSKMLPRNSSERRGTLIRHDKERRRYQYGENEGIKLNDPVDWGTSREMNSLVLSAKSHTLE